MQRAIVAFDQDEVGDWVVLLECGHRRHVRHRPPWQERPWVLTEQGRGERLGSPLECRLCDETSRDDAREGGDPSCWANQVCEECGAIEGHRPGCRRAGQSD